MNWWAKRYCDANLPVGNRTVNSYQLGQDSHFLGCQGANLVAGLSVFPLQKAKPH